MVMKVPPELAPKVHRSLFEVYRVYASNVFPVIVTTKKAELSGVLEAMDVLGLTVGQSMARFGMFSVLARPEDVQFIVSNKDVLFVDPDFPKFALRGGIRLPPLPPPPPIPFPPPPPFLPPMPLPFIQTKGAMVPANAKDGYIPTTVSRAYIGADVAEKEGFDGSGVTIAILDTGVFMVHPQINMKADDINAMLPISPKMPLPFLFDIPEPGMGIDDNGHGTHVITTIGGEAAKSTIVGLECKGVAPRAKLISIKVLGTPMGFGMTSDVLKGMEIALDRGAQIVSMSLGSDGGDNTYPEARVVNAHPEVIWCIAAGNSGPDPATVGTPGCAKEALTVGSFGILDKAVSHFSSRGPTNDGLVKPDVVAPGGGRAVAPDKTKGQIEEYIYSGTSLGSILDTIEDKIVDAYAALMGTSMATPHASGLAALALQAGHIKTTADIKRKMSAASGGLKDNNMGFGLITWNKLKAKV